MSDWIKINEKRSNLPEKEGEYLIFAETADPDCPIKTSCWFSLPPNEPGWRIVDYWQDRISHWMPLPPNPVDVDPIDEVPLEDL